MSSPAQDLAIEGVKVAPPVAVIGASFMGMTVDQWIASLTLVYLLGMIAHQIPKHWRGLVDLWMLLRKLVHRDCEPK